LGERKLSPNFIDSLVIIYYYSSMSNKSTLIKAIPYIAIAAATGAATYAFIKTYKTIKSLEDFDLDFGNDTVLSSVFNSKKVTNEE